MAETKPLEVTKAQLLTVPADASKPPSPEYKIQVEELVDKVLALGGGEEAAGDIDEQADVILDLADEIAETIEGSSLGTPAIKQSIVAEKHPDAYYLMSVLANSLDWLGNTHGWQYRNLLAVALGTSVFDHKYITPGIKQGLLEISIFYPQLVGDWTDYFLYTEEDGQTVVQTEAHNKIVERLRKLRKKKGHFTEQHYARLCIPLVDLAYDRLMEASDESFVLDPEPERVLEKAEKEKKVVTKEREKVLAGVGD